MLLDVKRLRLKLSCSKYPSNIHITRWNPRQALGLRFGGLDNYEDVLRGPMHKKTQRRNSKQQHPNESNHAIYAL